MAKIKSENCPNKENNLRNCACTYEPCARKGMCCECVQYHLQKNEIPGCFFSTNAEATYDRSLLNFISKKGR